MLQGTTPHFDSRQDLVMYVYTTYGTRWSMHCNVKGSRAAYSPALNYDGGYARMMELRPRILYGIRPTDSWAGPYEEPQFGLEFHGFMFHYVFHLFNREGCAFQRNRGYLDDPHIPAPANVTWGIGTARFRLDPNDHDVLPRMGEHHNGEDDNAPDA